MNSKNIGNLDRVLRIVIALVIIGLTISEFVTGPISWVLDVVAIVLVVTAFVRICPLYKLIGVNTCSINQ